MNQLFYQMIYQEKNKRWLILLDQLEEKQPVTGKELATHLGCSLRTIHSLTNQLKSYFGPSILLFGDEEGYHFVFRDPADYTKNKQALLDSERFFIFADQLISGERKTNQEWADHLSLSLASFGRMKRVFVKLLKDHYHLTIVGFDNQLQGGEPAVRQFMYELYFTLPLLPKLLAQRVETFSFSPPLETSGGWRLDPVRVKQWLHLAQWRIRQGNVLLAQKEQGKLQEKLAAALDVSLPCDLPPQEKAALFLLALDEEQFLDPLCQAVFVRQFAFKQEVPAEEEPLPLCFFRTIVPLMNHFFQLDSNEAQEELLKGAVEETRFFHKLVTHYYEQKERVENSVALSFELTGSMALQVWIKQTVRKQLQDTGCYLVESGNETWCPQRLTITNRPILQQQSDRIVLSHVPNETEIFQKLQAMAQQKEINV